MKAHLTLDQKDLVSLLRRAASAHHEYEAHLKVMALASNRKPEPDANWPEYYANWILTNAQCPILCTESESDFVREQAEWATWKPAPANPGMDDFLSVY